MLRAALQSRPTQEPAHVKAGLKVRHDPDGWATRAAPAMEKRRRQVLDGFRAGTSRRCDPLNPDPADLRLRCTPGEAAGCRGRLPARRDHHGNTRPPSARGLQIQTQRRLPPDGEAPADPAGRRKDAPRHAHRRPPGRHPAQRQRRAQDPRPGRRQPGGRTLVRRPRRRPGDPPRGDHRRRTHRVPAVPRRAGEPQDRRARRLRRHPRRTARVPAAHPRRRTAGCGRPASPPATISP